jgi:SAM-dependent methyltransferase
MYSTDLAYIHDRGFDEFATEVAPELVQILRGAGVKTGRVVELGCGGGTVARHLVDRGYQVRGFDISAAMIRLARARVPDASFTVASLTRARIPTCDAAVAVGEVVTYVPGGLPAIARFFRRVYRALRPGGVLLFDFIESAERRTYPPKSRGGSDWAIVLRADFDERTRVLSRRMTMFRKSGGSYRRSAETHRVRVYSREEIAGALRDAGFTVRMRRSFGRVRLIAGDVAVVAVREPRV